MQTTQATSNWELYKRLLGYLKSYWKMFIVSVVAMLIVAGTMPAFGYLLKPLINEGFVDKNMKSMSWLPLAIVALFFVRGLFNFINEYCTTYLSSHLVQRLRGEMFNKMMHLPTSYFSSNTGGRLMSRILSDVNQITDAGFNVITVIAKDGVSVVGLLGLLTYLNWRLTLITFIILPVVAVCIQTVSKRLRKLSANNQIYIGQLMQVLGESINGERVVKIYGGQDYENRRFNRIADDVRRNLLKQVSASSAGTGITQLMASVALAAIIYAAARQAGLSGFSAGDFMSFLSSMIMMFDPIKRMTGVMQSLQRGLAAAESVFTFLDQPEESNEGKQILSPNPGDIEFCDVVHRYPEAERNSLNHINLLVQQGKVTALVGASGCGKTTLANMLPRFLNPDEGKVLIGGVNVNEYTLESLRSRMAFVSQNVVLFNGTIAETLPMLKPVTSAKKKLSMLQKPPMLGNLSKKCRKACTLKLVKTV